MKRLRPKLTYANVISTLCLFLLLAGGSAFAAAEMLPKESVGTKQLKNGAVTGKKVKKGSLTATDFAPGQLPAGPRGPQGATGVKGATGAAGTAGAQGPPGTPGTGTVPSGGGGELAIEHVDASTPPSVGETKELGAVCPSGKVLGGGYVLNGGGTLRATRSYAITEGEWFVRAKNSGAAEAWELTVVAVCAK
jgi:hypothetical protein